jgi:hypothetical protein
MSKKTIVRRDAPHEVSMPAGSRDASSRSRAQTSGVQEPAPPAKRMVRSPKSEPAAVGKAPPSAAGLRNARGKANLGGQVSGTSVDVPRSAMASAVSRPVQREPRQDSDLWSAESPILRQLSQLRARNAQVSDHIQRLQQPVARPGGIQK